MLNSTEYCVLVRRNSLRLWDTPHRDTTTPKSIFFHGLMLIINSARMSTPETCLFSVPSCVRENIQTMRSCVQHSVLIIRSRRPCGKETKSGHFVRQPRRHKTRLAHAELATPSVRIFLRVRASSCPCSTEYSYASGRRMHPFPVPLFRMSQLQPPPGCLGQKQESTPLLSVA